MAKDENYAIAYGMGLTAEASGSAVENQPRRPSSEMLIFIVTGLIIDKIFSYILKINGKSFSSATIITVLLLILSMPIGVPLW